MHSPALLANPARLYINLHTTDFPGGVIRAQLRRTDTMKFDVTMCTANEVPPIPIDASAPARITAHTIRAEDGGVLAGMVEFDVNPRFPATPSSPACTYTTAPAGVNGPVTINTGLSAPTPSRAIPASAISTARSR